MNRAFQIAFACAVVFGASSYVLYRFILYTIAIGEGGDALGARGLLALFAMIGTIFLFIVSGSIALGLWIARLNSRRVDSTFLDLK